MFCEGMLKFGAMEKSIMCRKKKTRLQVKIMPALNSTQHMLPVMELIITHISIHP